MSLVDKDRTVPERLHYQVQFIFLLYSLKPQGGPGKQERLYRSLSGDQQAVKGKDPSFQPFLQVILFQVAGEVMLAGQIGSTRKVLSKSLKKSINHYLIICLFYIILFQS